MWAQSDCVPLDELSTSYMQQSNNLTIKQFCLLTYIVTAYKKKSPRGIPLGSIRIQFTKNFKLYSATTINFFDTVLPLLSVILTV